MIDIAMIDGISVLMIHLAGRMQMGQWSEQRGGNLLDGSAYFYRCYQTAEGRYVSVGAIEKPFHGEFLRTLGEDPGDYPAYLDPHRWPERITAIIQTRSKRQWDALFADRDACVTPVLTLEEAAASETYAARGSLIASDISIQPRPAPRFGRSATRVPRDTVSLTAKIDPTAKWKGPN